MYAVAFCYVFELKPKEPAIDLKELKLAAISPETASALAVEFSRLISDFTCFKAFLGVFKGQLRIDPRKRSNLQDYLLDTKAAELPSKSPV